MAPIMGFVTELEASFDFERWEECQNTVGDAESCIDCCHERYFNGNEIDYECDQFRKTYIMRFLPVHIHENYLALRRIPTDVLDTIGQSETVNFLSLGGGPGSDIAAFKKHIDNGYFENMRTQSFHIVRVDREDDWNGLATRVINLFRCRNYEVRHTKLHQDVLVPFTNQQNIHIVTLSYLISEIAEESIPVLARNIATVLADTAVIVINDRDEDVVRRKAENLLQNLNIDTYDERNGREWCGEFFPDDVRDRISPKLKTNSIRYTAVKR
ncbi:MAG: hypothetical protein WCK54_09920 [Desulfuromonadales bacterium]